MKRSKKIELPMKKNIKQSIRSTTDTDFKISR